MQSDWIKFDEAMPALNQEVEVEFYGGEIFKTTLRTFDCKKFYFSEKNNYHPPGFQGVRWRPLLEKRPDFNKLRVGDFIVFTYGEEKQRVGGYLIENNLTEQYLKISIEKNEKGYKILIGFLFSRISRIQRINFADNKIEEI